MPIYEFYCRPCHTVFSFFARKVDTTTVPPCPNCKATLSREVSQVAYVRTGGDTGGEDGLGDAPIDEARMERAMDAMAGDIDRVGDTEDPRQAAELMRKFSDLSGLRFNGDIEEALDRMSKGDDPDAVGEDLDALMESGAEPFVPEGRGRRVRRVPVYRDPTLHDL
jgi:putative FmdB family regulatory protein